MNQLRKLAIAVATISVLALGVFALARKHPAAIHPQGGDVIIIKGGSLSIQCPDPANHECFAFDAASATCLFPSRSILSAAVRVPPVIRVRQPSLHSADEKFNSTTQGLSGICCIDFPSELRRWQIPAACPTVISPESKSKIVFQI